MKLLQICIYGLLSKRQLSIGSTSLTHTHTKYCQSLAAYCSAIRLGIAKTNAYLKKVQLQKVKINSQAFFAHSYGKNEQIQSVNLIFSLETQFRLKYWYWYWQKLLWKYEPNEFLLKERYRTAENTS